MSIAPKYLKKVEIVMSRKLDKAKLKSQLGNSHGSTEIYLTTAQGDLKGCVSKKELYKFLKVTAPLFVPVESNPIPRPITYDLTVKKVFASEILDSRGYLTIEVHLVTDRGVYRAAVPSDIMVGSDARLVSNTDIRKKVEKAISDIENIIGPQLVKSGLKVTNQFEVDDFLRRLDGGAENKENLGANALLAVSMAVCKAGADYKHQKLYQHIAELSNTSQMFIPAPIFTLISSGYKSKANKLAVKEFYVSPVGASTFHEAMKIGMEIYFALRDIIESMYGPGAVANADDGSFAPSKIDDSKEALRAIKSAIERTGNKDKVIVGLNMGASEFYNKSTGKYDMEFKPDGGSDSREWITGSKLGNFYKELVEEFKIEFIEDAFGREDWKSWTDFNANGPTNMQLVGGALTCGDQARFEEAMQHGACNSVLLKLNQVATISEFIHRAKMARKGGWSVVVGTTLGETGDPFIGNLCIGLGNGQIKAGAPCRERVATYNGLMRLEKEAEGDASYVGKKYRRPCDLN